MENNCTCYNNRDYLLKQIMSLNFAINDLALYLDTHPNDTCALKMHNEYSQKVSELSNKYQALYGPLTINSSSNTWEWINSPWPWERGAY